MRNSYSTNKNSCSNPSPCIGEGKMLTLTQISKLTKFAKKFHPLPLEREGIKDKEKK